MTHQNLIVIGGGAAGIFGAISASEKAKQLVGNKKFKTIVLEQGVEPLTKVRISGGGRCNVMHDENILPRDLVKNYPRGRRELLGMMTSRFGPRKTSLWFREHGITLKTENDGRMFPITDDSQTVISCLLNTSKLLNINIMTKTKVLSISTTYKSETMNHHKIFQVSMRKLNKDDHREYVIENVTCDRLLLCPGSSKLVWKWLHNMFGHEIIQPVPSLFTLNLKECKKQDITPSSSSSLSPSIPLTGSKKDDWFFDLAGISLPNVILTLNVEVNKNDYKDQRKDVSLPSKTLDDRNSNDKSSTTTSPSSCVRYHSSGPVLITHHGLSGPAALRLSAFAARPLNEAQYRGIIEVNWLGQTTTSSSLSTSSTSSSSTATSDGVMMAHLISLLKLCRSGKLYHQLPPHSQYHERLDLRSKYISTFFPLNKQHFLTSSSSSLKKKMLKKNIFEMSDMKIQKEKQKQIKEINKMKEFNVNNNKKEVSKEEVEEVEEEDDSKFCCLIPKRLWHALLRRCSIPNDLRWSSMSDEQISKIAMTLLKSTVHMTGKGLYKEEFVTCGGVSLNEVNLNTMESKVVPGMYFAGEVLNIDGVTGGFNFQSCWSTGFVAGESIAESTL